MPESSGAFLSRTPDVYDAAAKIVSATSPVAARNEAFWTSLMHIKAHGRRSVQRYTFRHVCGSVPTGRCCIAGIPGADPMLVKALDDPATRKRLLEFGSVIPDRAGRSPEALASLVKSEVARWTPILKAAGAAAAQ
jgi:hypothetical protein